jgi:hypothetical protein
MRHIVRLLVTVLFLLFALVLVFCPKTAMAQGPVSVGLLENDEYGCLKSGSNVIASTDRVSVPRSLVTLACLSLLINR